MNVVSDVFSGGMIVRHKLGFTYTEFEDVAGVSWSELQQKYTGLSAAVVSAAGEVLCLAQDFSAAIPANGRVIALNAAEYKATAALSDPVFADGEFTERLSDAQLATVDVHQLRKQAYMVESDPLYLEFQYDQSPAAERRWRDKVAEIKARYPLPDSTYQKEGV